MKDSDGVALTATPQSFPVDLGVPRITDKGEIQLAEFKAVARDPRKRGLTQLGWFSEGWDAAEKRQHHQSISPAAVLASLTELADTLDKYVVWETANGGSRLRLPLARAIRIVALSGGAELDPTRCPYCLGSLYEFQDADEHGVFSYFACEGERHTFRASRDSGDFLPDFSEVEVEDRP